MNRRNLRNFVLYSLSMTAGAIIFSPALYTFLWHVFHRNGVHFLEFSIQVPQGYYADVENNRTQISKLATTVFAKRPAVAMITFWPNKPAPSTAAETESSFQTFASVYWTKLSGERGTTTGPFRRGEGQSQSVCMQTAYGPASDTRLAISCLAFQGRVYATFYGSPAETQNFYKIINDAD